MKSILISLIVPLNLCIFLVFLGVLFVLFKKIRLAIISVFAGIIWLVVWSLPITTLYLGGYLENMYSFVPAPQRPSAQVIVVFGGNTANNRTNWFEPYSRQAQHARIDTANELYSAGKASTIILSGAALDGKVSEAKGMAMQLSQKGVPQEALIIENQSTTTRENGFYVDKILKEKEIKDILLVTSALHMPRAMAVMKKLGYQPTAAPNPVQIILPKDMNPYLPNKRTLDASRSIIKEYIGLTTYWLRNWI